MSIEYYNRNNYIELENIIPVDQWILYDDYIKVWSQIWKFIERKRRTHSVYINNFAYNYMDTKEFYFSWEQKGEVVDGELIKHCKFDNLDINHEHTRYQRRKEMEKIYNQDINKLSADNLPVPPCDEIRGASQL